jgi:hypothetical protein
MTKFGGQGILQPKLGPRALVNVGSCRGLTRFAKFAGDTPAATVKRLGAVSSVVEHLVYTERVGGSKPSPPIFQWKVTSES